MCTPILVTPLNNSWTYANMLIFCNVKTLWIFMFSRANVFLTKYKSLVIQMFEEHVVHDFFKANLELLCDNEVFLGLICIIPILQCVQGMSRFAQTYDVLICDFIVVVKTFKWIYIICIIEPTFRD